MLTPALLRLGFPSAPHLLVLNLAGMDNSPDRSTKSTRSRLNAVPQLVNTGFQVLFHSPPGVLFTFPSQYSALSVTILRIPLARYRFHVRGFHPLWPDFPIRSISESRHLSRSITPACTHAGLGSFHFARRYFGNRCFFLFLRLLRCFSSPGSPRTPMDSAHADWVFPSRVSPFRHLRITRYLPFPGAFRSLSRLSSALSAKASALCSYLLGQSDSSAGSLLS